MDNLWIWLLGIPTPLKHMKVSWDDYSQYMEIKNVPKHQSDELVIVAATLVYQTKAHSLKSHTNKSVRNDQTLSPLVS